MSTEQDTTVACRDGCGNTKPSMDAAISAGWQLPITGALRCWDCRRALAAAAGVHGTYEQGFVDQLPPDSIGALHHRGSTLTASTIVPPSVRA